MANLQSPPPVPPDLSWWRHYWTGFKKKFLDRFDTQGDWLVFGLVALAVLWLSIRVIGLLRKLLGW